MNGAAKLRCKFINEAAEFMLDEYISVVKGEGEFSSNDPSARKEIWDLLKSIISGAGDPSGVSLVAFNSNSVVEEIMTQVANGELTLDEGKQFMQLASMGFEITELPELMAKFNELV